MKYLVLIWMIFCPGIGGFAQDLNVLTPYTYEPFIRETKQWKYLQQIYATSGSDGATNIVHNVYFKGDTIVDNLKYSKLFHKSEQPKQGKAYVAYMMREDTVNQKVYVFDPQYKQTALLYDFKLNKGDEFNIYILSSLYKKHTVVKVDTITAFNRKLNRIEFDNSTTWIEGIGDVTGSYIPASGELICVRENNDLLYLNPTYSNCDTIFTQGSWDNIQTIKSNEVLVFPNPVVSTSVVRVNTPYNAPLKIEIYSYLGTLVKEDYFSGNYPIGSIDLQKGIYVYRIIHNNQVVKMDKVIVASGNSGK